MTVVIDGTTGVDTIQNNTVTSAKIVDGAITAPDLNGAQSGSAPIFGARAWCVFDGTLTGTNAPTAGGNVTSVTKNGTGDYTINFTTAMPTANYAVVGWARDTVTNFPYLSGSIAAAPATGSVRVRVANGANATVDAPFITAVIFG